MPSHLPPTPAPGHAASSASARPDGGHRPPRLLLNGLAVAAALLLAACAGTPEPRPGYEPPADAATPRPGGVGAAVRYALSLQGAPYRHGKSSPQEGFDCSGFVWHVYRRHGIHLPRTAKEMAQALPPVPKPQASAGDLVFFNTDGKPFSHVGIYVADGQFVHAPSQRRSRVSLSSLDNPYWRRRFVGLRRPGAHHRR